MSVGMVNIQTPVEGGCILLILSPVSAPEHPGRFLLRSQETIETASPVFDVISPTVQRLLGLLRLLVPSTRL